jgi:alkylation response protein AidB-like acyl-CoA dehydrogenase
MRKLTAHQSQVPALTHLRDDEKKYREKVRCFAEECVAPLSMEMDRNAKLDQTLIRQLFDEGLMSIEIPSEYGGQNGNLFKTVVAIEELSRIDPAVAVFVDVQNTLVVSAFNRWGTPEQKKRCLPLMARETAGAFSITEKHSGSDAYAMTSQAVKVDGGYLLKGNKHWVTNAAEAGIFLVFATTNPGNAREGITSFIVHKKDVSGFAVEAPEEKMGIRASSTCALVLDDVFIAEENILGGAGRGSQVALETLTVGRVGIAAQMVGLAQGALEAAIAHAEGRKQFGKRIISYQGVHFPLAEMATDVEAARLMTYNAARINTLQENPVECFTSASMAKLYASKVAESVASRALDIFGGKGYMKGSSIEKLYRDAKIGKIYEGTSNMQMSTIARTLMKTGSGRKSAQGSDD